MWQSGLLAGRVVGSISVTVALGGRLGCSKKHPAARTKVKSRQRGRSEGREVRSERHKNPWKTACLHRSFFTSLPSFINLRALRCEGRIEKREAKLRLFFISLLTPHSFPMPATPVFGALAPT
jgi:hypothetical protein